MGHELGLNTVHRGEGGVLDPFSGYTESLTAPRPCAGDEREG